MTVTAIRTIRLVANQATPGQIADVFRKIALGDMLKAVEETITIASSTTLKLSAASAAKRAALVLQSVRVVTGAATGIRSIGDSAATPSTTLVAFDGDTITFEAAITVAKVRWIPAALVDIDLSFT